MGKKIGDRDPMKMPKRNFKSDAYDEEKKRSIIEQNRERFAYRIQMNKERRSELARACGGYHGDKKTKEEIDALTPEQKLKRERMIRTNRKYNRTRSKHHDNQRRMIAMGCKLVIILLRELTRHNATLQIGRDPDNVLYPIVHRYDRQYRFALGGVMGYIQGEDNNNLIHEVTTITW